MAIISVNTIHVLFSTLQDIRHENMQFHTQCFKHLPWINSLGNSSHQTSKVIDYALRFMAIMYRVILVFAKCERDVKTWKTALLLVLTNI